MIISIIVINLFPLIFRGQDIVEIFMDVSWL